MADLRALSTRRNNIVTTDSIAVKAKIPKTSLNLRSLHINKEDRATMANKISEVSRQSKTSHDVAPRMKKARKFNSENNIKLVRKLRYEVERTEINASVSNNDGLSLGASIKHYSKYYENLPSCCVIDKVIPKSYLEESTIEYGAGFNSNGSPEINPSVKKALIFEREFRYTPKDNCTVSCSSGKSSGSVSKPSWFFDNIIEPFSKAKKL